MAIDPEPMDPDLVRLEALIGCADKRLQRAVEKYEGAKRELAEATDGVADAIHDRDQWIRDHPPAQPDLFRGGEDHGPGDR